jgi:predicted acyl esterase
VTLIGQPVITGKVVTKGRYGQLVARVWDLDPKSGRQSMITRGVYRLRDDQKGKFSFTLDGNGWKFPKAHRIVVELLGRDAPTYARSPTSFSASVTSVKVKLPVRDRPSKKRRITKP